MSKISATWAAFLVGSLVPAFVPQNVGAQSVQPETSIPTLEIRGPVDISDLPANPPRQQNFDNQAPIELGQTGIENSASANTLNRQFSTDIDQSADDLGQTKTQGRTRNSANNTNRASSSNDLVPNNRQRRAQPSGAVGLDPDDTTSSTRANVAVDPVQTGTAATEEADPFAANGLRLGTFDVQLSLEQSVGYSNNVSQNVGGDGGAFSQTDIAASFTSDWSRHEWQTNLRGSLRKPFDGAETSNRSLFADTQLRLDLIDGHSLTGRVFYNATTQEFTDTTLAPGVVDTPLEENYGASLALARSDRKFVYTLRGSIQENRFEDATLGGGVTLSQADRESRVYSVGLRTGYEVSPAVTPFVEGIYSVRNFDLAVDRNGNRRDSNTYELRGGIELDLGEKVQGEFSVGYVNESFDDSRLEDLSGVTFNGVLNWSPERDSLITLTIGTATNTSITQNDNGSLTYNTRVDYQRQVNDRLLVSAFAGVEVQTNNARNTTWDFGIGTQYWVNRFMALTSNIEYQNFNSDAAGSGFDALSGRVGVRLQR